MAWFEVNGLYEVTSARSNVTPRPPHIRKYAMQESEVQSFHVYPDRDWRNYKFFIMSTLTFANGNVLHVQETYEELAVLVGLKTKVIEV